MSERLDITEESGVHKAWMVEAKQMTMDKLPEFLRKLTEDYSHDYGTICHAIAAAGIAAMNAVESSPEGGITGFQARCIQWEIIKGWGIHPEGSPLRLINMDDMLYPQHDYKFKTISPELWNRLQEKARSNLDQKEGHPDVRKHWESIASGVVPFGYTVKAD